MKNTQRAQVVSFLTGLPSGHFRWCPVHHGGRITSRRKALREVSRHHARCYA